jgi:hypothetical protein
MSKNWILLWRCVEHGTMIYCRDKKWRKHPNFGDFSECVKQYTTSKRALMAIKHRYLDDYEAVHINSAAARALGIGSALGDDPIAFNLVWPLLRNR